VNEKLPVGLLNVPVKEWCEWWLNDSVPVGLGVVENESEESARLVRDDAGGGGRLKLPVGLVKLSVKVKDGRPVGFVKVKDGRPVGLVKVKDGNPVKLESARLSATGAAFKRL
jgi:hypothetical protein